ncbi:MAG: MFS transporter [Oscillospiraceae bacterium]|nr:MFS transporter [Oscillospiraceae bacterium]
MNRNARALVFLEPLFGIPHTMYIGYLTLYMLALGLSKAQVGIVTSLGLIANFVFASVSAYTADKLGRKKTIIIFDLISWSVAQLIWAFADRFSHFVIAYIINASVQLVGNAFVCTMLEDNKPEDRVNIYNFIQISGIVAGFFAPVGALLISRLTLIPAMRVMQLIGFTMITSQIIIRHLLISETSVGIRKMSQMKQVKVWQVFSAYIPAFKRIINNKLLVLILLLRSLNHIQLTIRNTYLAVLVTEHLGFTPGSMSLFYTVNSVVVLFVLLFISPLLAKITGRWPVIIGIVMHIASTVILLVSPQTQNYYLLILSAILIAAGTGITTPYIDAFAANTISDEDRAASNSVMSMAMMLLSTPFGYIGGVLSELDARAPFLLTFAIFILCLVLLYFIIRREKRTLTVT